MVLNLSDTHLLKESFYTSPSCLRYKKLDLRGVIQPPSTVLRKPLNPCPTYIYSGPIAHVRITMTGTEP
jgi:hypothetical protein